MSVEWIALVLLCLFTLCDTGLIPEHGPAAVKVFAKEGSDVILPCYLNKNIENLFFDWRKAGPEEVFLYNAGRHYNNGYPGQSVEFKGRVFHFPDELKHGNASITIRGMQAADRGNYTCDFHRLQPPQIFHVELEIEYISKDRSGEKPEAAAKPCVTILEATDEWQLLQCEVRGASPKPIVEWKDRDGNSVPAEQPVVTESGGRYDIILNATMTKTGRYRCVVTQEEIHHQTYAETLVHISVCDQKPAEKDSSSQDAIGWLGGTVIGFVLGAVALLVCQRVNKRVSCKGRHHQENGSAPQSDRSADNGKGLKENGESLSLKENGRIDIEDS